MVFGRCLHRYSIADGIRDHNVLGFDPYMVTRTKDSEVRRAVALDKAKAESAERCARRLGQGQSIPALHG